LSENEEIDSIKKRLKEISTINPRYFEILSEPQFKLIPTIDSSAREFLNSQNIRSIADLAIQDADILTSLFIKSKHFADIVKEWLILPGNLSVFRELWDNEQNPSEFDIESLKFPVECAECHKKIKESDDFLLRVDNNIYCTKCASYYVECQSCSKIFVADYSDPSYFGEDPEFCPDCEKNERHFIQYLKKLPVDEKVNVIISSWIELAIDLILHRNMHWYLSENIKN